MQQSLQHVDKSLANRLVDGASDEDIIGKIAAQTKEEIQDVMKSDSRTEIVELIVKNLVPKFGNNELKHNPYDTMSKLRIQNDGSFKKLHAQAKDIRCTLQFLKEDVDLHTLILRFLENLECTLNHRESTRKFLLKIRD